MSQSIVAGPGEVAEVLKAAGEPTRLRILKALEDGELCACHVVALVGLSQPTVSRHISVLRSAGLVRERKEGRWTWFRLAGEGPLAAGVLALLAGWEDDPVVLADRRRTREFRSIPLAEFCSGRTGGCE